VSAEYLVAQTDALSEQWLGHLTAAQMDGYWAAQTALLKAASRADPSEAQTAARSAAHSAEQRDKS